MDGVLDTRSGWIGSLEVVTVEYDPRTITYEKLLDTAIEKDCAARAWWTTPEQSRIAIKKLKAAASKLDGPVRDAKASDQLYYVERTNYGKLPLTPLQARRVNGALYTRQDPRQWLSPRQLELLQRIEKAAPKARKALGELKRPTTVSGLASYESDLRARLQRQ